MKKTLMITGADGYIGSYFTREYGQGYNIIPIDLLTVKPEDVDYSKTDCVLHLAAIVHQMKGIDEATYRRVNTHLAIRVAKMAKAGGVKHFVFFSTMAVYGSHGTLEGAPEPLSENSPCRASDPYGSSKYEAEKLIKEIEDENFTVSIIRPPMVYGEKCPGNMIRLMKLVKLLPVLPFNYEDNRRSVLYIKNLMEFTHIVVQKGESGVFLPQDAETVSIRYLVSEISRGMGKRVRLVKLPGFVYRLLCAKKKRLMSSLYGSLVYDPSVTNQRLGYNARYSTQEGIHSMCRDYLGNKKPFLLSRRRVSYD